jgi:hypothetical protein
MGRRFATAGLLLATTLALTLPAPAALACDAPGVSCSSDEAPPAALAPGAGERCEAPRVVPGAAARPRPAVVPLNPNGYNQRGPEAGDLAEVLRRVERERSQAEREARR